MPPKTLLLVGGGHAHIQVIREFPHLPDVHFVLVSDDNDAVYSGMLPAVVAGLRNPGDALVNLPQLCKWKRWRFIRGRAVRIDPLSNSVTVQTFALRETSDAPLTIKYDVLSLDIGSTTRQIPGIRREPQDPYLQTASSVEPRVPMVLSTRPIGRLSQGVERFERAVRDFRGATQTERTVVVVGGGAAGVELAFALEARLRRSLHSVCEIQVVLVNTGALSSQFGCALGKTVRAQLRARGIAEVSGRAAAVDEAAGLVRFNDGVVRKFDLLVAATGAAAHPWVQERSGLDLDAHGFILVEPTLATTRYPNVYAAGDCASFGGRFGDGFPPKAGVYAVRQGPILTHNLLEAITGTGAPGKAYKPQTTFLALLATGDGSAIGTKYGLAFSGTWVYHLKSYIDESWQRCFQMQNEGCGDRSENNGKMVEFSGSPSEGAARLLAASDISTSDAFDVQLAVLRRMDDDPSFRDQVVQVVTSKK